MIEEQHSFQYELARRVRAVEPPTPVMAKERESSLTARQRELLDQCQPIFLQGFAHLTMADLASILRCSLRTLYGLAPSRDELVLTVGDRYLWAIGRTTSRAAAEATDAVSAIRSYLGAANMAVSAVTPEFARDIETVSGGLALYDSHSHYLVRVTRAMLDFAIERDEIVDVDTPAVASTIASLGRELSRPEVLVTLKSSPKVAADQIVAAVLHGLQIHEAPVSVFD